MRFHATTSPASVPSATAAAALHVLPDAATLYRAAAERLLALGEQAIAARGAFHLALAGGATPRGLYTLLASPELCRRLDWTRVRLYFGDERCVAPDHPDSNYRMVRESLLDALPAAPQVHRITGELAPEQAAADYAAQLAAHLPDGVFDLALLGLGPDGHIASLFPGSGALDEPQAPVAALYVPHLDAWRISLTLPLLNRARHLLLLVSGAAKAAVVRQALRDATAGLPVQRLRPRGALEWFLDAEAAARLTPGSAPS